MKNHQTGTLLMQLQTALPAQVRSWLQQAVNIARQQHIPIYLVGGPVRDLLLGHTSIDLDLVVEGDAWPIAEPFAAASGGKLTKHPAFRTATVELKLNNTSFPIDVVTARRETYPEPAALPVVEPSHMRDDLFRRDFTINALALRLDNGGALLDPYDGVRDLNDQLVRVLHDRSFIDDPTRILRAVRFAARLRFRIEDHTAALIRAALGEHMIEHTSPQRMLNEIWLLLDEAQPEEVLRLLQELGALEQLGFRWNGDWPEQFAAARILGLQHTTLRIVYWGLLVWPLDEPQRQVLATRYNLPSAERKVLHELPTAIPTALTTSKLDAVALDQLLRHYDTAALHTLQLVAPSVAAANIARYLEHVRPMPPLLRGADLQQLGVPPGPRYGQLLEQLRQAQLQGSITNHEDALAWVRQQVAIDTA
jgi:tRNA nucleotidyltransferase (CCA-adding enzyme)